MKHVGETGVDVIYSANLQNEAQATALHTAGAPEFSIDQIRIQQAGETLLSLSPA